MTINEGIAQGFYPPRVSRPGDRRRSVSRSATRALDVLELFGELRRPLRAIEIARCLELHPATADQLLKTMVDSAHLVFEARRKTYLPSPRLAGFSDWTIAMFGKGQALRVLVRDMQAKIGGVVTLATVNDLSMQILDCRGYSTRHDPPERGLKTAIFQSVHGWAYLSTLPAPEIKRLAKRARVPDAKHPELLLQLDEIRGAGFAETAIPERRAWTLAVPFPTRFFGYPLVLGVTGPEELFEDCASLYERLHHDMMSSLDGIYH